MSQALHIKGAVIRDGEESQVRDLFVKNGRIVAEKPNHALEVDLEGYTIFPGLINAHDHLELNHYPRTKFREVYDNAHQWGEDVNARLNDEPFKTLRNYPLWDRVFIGGLKNLLCGATTVIHHGPPHKPMFRKDFPVRVLKNYGWAHSLHFNTEEEIIRSYKSSKGYYWFIHLAEGTDSTANSELKKLHQLGCLSWRTAIIHAVGLSEDDIALLDYQQCMIWCPSTNNYLLNEVKNPFAQSRGIFYLGSDSRLTANGDLLDEIRFIHTNFPEISIDDLLYTAMLNPIFDPDPNVYDHLCLITIMKRQADFIVVPKSKNVGVDFCNMSRSNISMIMKEGIPQIGDPELMVKFPHIQTIACTLDGVDKRMNIDLARQVHRCQLKEQGLEVDDLPSGKRFIFF